MKQQTCAWFIGVHKRYDRLGDYIAREMADQCVEEETCQPYEGLSWGKLSDHIALDVLCHTVPRYLQNAEQHNQIHFEVLCWVIFS